METLAIGVDGVTVFVESAPDAASASLIARSVARVAGIDENAVTIDRACLRCGSHEHGKPRVTAPDGYDVSISRSGRRAVAAVAKGKSVGIDIESIARIARAPVESVLLFGTERAALEALVEDDRPAYLATLWTVKEAVLKASGDGLTLDPQLLKVEVGEGRAFLTSWPTSLGLSGVPHITLFALDDDVVGAIAVLPTARPSATAEAPAQTTTPRSPV